MDFPPFGPYQYTMNDFSGDQEIIIQGPSASEAFIQCKGCRGMYSYDSFGHEQCHRPKIDSDMRRDTYPAGTHVSWYDRGVRSGLVSGYIRNGLMIRVTSQKQTFTCSVYPGDCQIVQDAETICKPGTTDYHYTCPICLDDSQFMRSSPQKVRVCKNDWRHLACTGCAVQLTECPICRSPLFG
jgi:hypothetical protein